MESNKDKNYGRYVSYAIIIILIILLLFQQWKSGKNEDRLIKNIATYSDSASFYKTKSGLDVATNKSLILNSEEQLKAMVALTADTKEIIKKYKDLKSVTYITNNFTAGGDTIRHNSIPCDFTPFPVRHISKEYTFKGTVGKGFFSVDSLIVPDTLKIFQGRKKTGFLKYAYSMDVTHSNELMKTTNIADYRYIPEKKIWEKTWVHWIEGAAIQSGLQWGIKQAVKGIGK